MQPDESASFDPLVFGKTTIESTVGVCHMKGIAILIGLCLMGVGVAQGATPTAQEQCEAQAAAKKLAGAAKTSFVGKCVKDAPVNAKASQCEQAAADKKLAGAAKNSFVQKCVKTA